MARLLTFTLLLAVCLAGFGCGGDDDTDSPTNQQDDSDETASSGATLETEPAEAWSGEVSGPISGTFTSALAPQCAVGDDAVSVSLQGIVGGESVVVSIFAAGPGTFDFAHPSDESPTVDIATTGDPPAEWYGGAGLTGSGELTLGEDGSGTANITLPTIVTGNQEDITLAAEWTCPAQ